MFDKELDRVRLPRYIGSDSVVRPYDHREARGWNWLRNLDRGFYAKEEYRAHLGLSIHISLIQKRIAI